MNSGVTLLALAVVAAIVVGLYLLRPPPQRVAVGSTLLWRRVLAAQKGLSQRWRWWLSLLLALAIALALAAALTGRDGVAPAADPRDVVVVVDSGPTMNAMRSDGRTRFEHARGWAIDEIRRLGAGARFFVTDTMRTVSTGTFVDAAQAQAVLETLKPARGGAPRFPDLAMLPASTAGRDLVLVSDGVAPLDAPEGVRTHSVFEPAGNVGITAFSVRPRATDAARYEGFVELGNAGGTAVTVALRVAGAGRDALTRNASVPARGFASLSFPLDGFTGGALQATVSTPGDMLDLDDTAFAFLPFNRVLDVALVTPGNPDLERALKLDTRLRVRVVAPAQYASRTGFDAYVFDRFAPPKPPLAPALVFHAGAVEWLAPATAPVRAPEFAGWVTDHPVLENVSLSDVVVEKGVAFRTVGPGVQTLATDASGQPLVVARDRTPRVVAVGFAPSESNFASQASFPVFLANALQWLSAEVPPQSASVGAVRVPFENAKVEAVRAGRVETRAVPGGTLFSLPAPDFATVEAEGVRMRVAVNTTDPDITDINASALPPAAAASATLAEAPASSDTPWWPLLIGAAALLMVLEWLAYHRRLTV